MTHAEIRKLTQGRRCFMCKWIRMDLRKHKRLTAYKFDYRGDGLFPVKAKLRHLQLCAAKDGLRD